MIRVNLFYDLSAYIIDYSEFNKLNSGWSSSDILSLLIKFSNYLIIKIIAGNQNNILKNA